MIFKQTAPQASGFFHTHLSDKTNSYRVVYLKTFSDGSQLVNDPLEDIPKLPNHYIWGDQITEQTIEKIIG